MQAQNDLYYKLSTFIVLFLFILVGLSRERSKNESQHLNNNCTEFVSQIDKILRTKGSVHSHQGPLL
jgi:hypothetical protein